MQEYFAGEQLGRCAPMGAECAECAPMGAPLAAVADGSAGAAVSTGSTARLASGSGLYASPEYRDKRCSRNRAMPRNVVWCIFAEKNHFSRKKKLFDLEKYLYFLTLNDYI